MAVFRSRWLRADRGTTGSALSTSGGNEVRDVRHNADPLDSDPIQTTKALWARQFFKNAYTVVVNPAVDGICYHGLFDRIDWGRYQQQVAEREQMPEPSPVIGTHDQLLVWSEGYPAFDSERKFPNGVLYRAWDTLIDQLRTKVGSEATVALFPCSAIQILARE